MNGLIPVVLLVVPAIVSLIGCSTPTNHLPRSESSHHSVQLVEGDYLSTEYIEQLRRTRSPWKAGGRGGGLKLLQVRRDGEQFVLQPILNFHEGTSEFMLRSDGSVGLSPESRGADVSNLSATVLDDHTIRFGYGDFTPDTYIRVKDAAAYVSQAVLVGRYKDERGSRYVFREDGWAVFPDRRFEFEIGLDHVLNDYDYFMDAGKDKKHLPWRVWAFKWNRNTLEIYRTKEVGGGIERIIDSHPFLSLHPAE